MAAWPGRDKQGDSKTDHEHQNYDLPFDDRIYDKKNKVYGKIFKVISKA